MQMDRREFVKVGSLSVLGDVLPTSVVERRQYNVGAYYFPNFHVDPRNEKVHGNGWTEWEVSKRGEPRFDGHKQPKKPAWGYLDESSPAVFEKKIAAAHEAGVTHFIFDWYWYDGKPFLQRALEEGYQHAANSKDVKFCLMWANHDWYNLMPARLDRQESSSLFKGTYSESEFERVTDYIIQHSFSDPRYFKVDGAPYFSIYEIANLVERMGGIEVAQRAFESFRRRMRSAGFNDLYLNAVAQGLVKGADPTRLLNALAVRSITSYTWVHHFELQTFPATEYASAMQAAPAYWVKAQGMFAIPYEPDVSMGWDASPRTCQSDTFQRGEYPYYPVLVNNTPELFRASLFQAKAYLDAHPEHPGIVNINSWNEWTEGSYLEPDSLHGLAYLDAVRNVFGV